MKYTAEEREEIKGWILELHLIGIRKTREIRKVLKEQKEREVSERHIRRLREDVRQETIKSSQFDRDEQIGIAIGRLESIYRKCISRKDGADFRGALAAQKELDELLGLKVLHIEHSAKVPFANWLQGLKPPESKPTNGKKPAANGASGGESG